MGFIRPDSVYIYKIIGSSSLFLKKVTKKITEEHQLFVSSSLVSYMTGSNFEITGVGGEPLVVQEEEKNLLFPPWHYPYLVFKFYASEKEGSDFILE